MDDPDVQVLGEDQHPGAGSHVWLHLRVPPTWPFTDCFDDAPIEYDGWVWRYDLRPIQPTKPRSRWPTTGRECRRTIAISSFPPFGRQHLDNSLKHLAELAELV